MMIDEHVNNEILIMIYHYMVRNNVIKVVN